MTHTKKSICFFAFIVWSSHCFADWPSLPIPENARAESIGESVTLNGVPMRMHRIVSKDRPLKLEQFYQRYFGVNHTKTEMPNTVVLAQGNDAYFTTVRITPLGNGLTEVLTSISEGQAAKNNRNRPLGLVLPAESQLVMDMESVDAGKNSRQLIFNNGHSMQANADFMTKVMQGKGYILEPKLSVSNASSRSLMFGGKNREARLVVSQDGDGSSVVLTSILGP